MKRRKVVALLLTAIIAVSCVPASLSRSNAAQTDILSGMKAVFIHHSTGGQWLADGYGNLGSALAGEGVFLSDICYGWDAPYNTDIGSSTDIGNWYTWFADTTPQANSVARRDNIMNAVYTEYDMDGAYGNYTRIADPDSGSENTVIIFKSCYPNSDVVAGSVANTADIYGKAVDSGVYSEANVHAVYNSILPYMLDHPDKLFVVITAPSRVYYSNAANAARARSLNDWLVNDWLDGNENKNVYVWDYFNVLTDSANYHKVVGGTVTHYTAPASGNITLAAYHSGSDEHPNAAADQRATEQFVPCLEVFAQTWATWRSSSTPLTNASVTPATAVYDKSTASTGVSFTLNEGSYTLSAIKNGSQTLVANTDYTASGGVYVIKQSYLNAQGTGTLLLDFDMNGGSDPRVSIAISDSTPPSGLAIDDIGCYEFGYSGDTFPNNTRYSYDHFGGGGTLYYVSTEGSDSQGAGTEDDPWRTLGYAASQVTAPGSVIHMAAGRYNEQSQVYLAAGVSVEGAGDGSINGEAVTAIYTTGIARLNAAGAAWEVPNSIVNLISSSNTNGNQCISGIRFEGDESDTASPNAGEAIEIQNRNNVQIRDCTFVDFFSYGVGWRSTLVNGTSGTGSYCTGGSFNDNTVTNCAGYNTTQNYYYGALFCGGLEGLLIYDNYMVEGQRDTGKALEGTQAENGVSIKFWYYDGWVVNCKVFDNYLEKSWLPRFPGNYTGWPFALESQNISGIEIYDNTVVGTLDLTYGKVGTVNGINYDYAAWVHDNTIGPPQYSIMTYDGVCLEGSVERTIIERNIIRNCCPAVLVNSQPTGVWDLTIRYNLCTGIAAQRGDWYADGIIINGPLSSYTVSNLNIHNNVLIGAVHPVTNEGPGYAITLNRNPNDGAVLVGQNITFANNIMCGFGYTWASFFPNVYNISGFSSINGLNIESNIYYNNAGDTGLINGSSVPVNYTDSGNLAGVDPQFVSSTDYRLRATSPAIDAGKIMSSASSRDLACNPVPYTGGAILYYTLSYNANGGSGHMGNGYARSEAAFTLPECGFTAPAGKRFSHWAVGSAGGTEINAGTSFVFSANTVLYAVWENAPDYSFAVTANINGGASKLYEPWGLRYFAVFSGEDIDSIANRGIAILKATYYNSTMTAAQLCASSHAYVFNSRDGELGYEAPTTANPNGRYYATLTEGIYSYDIGSYYYVVPFAEMSNGQVIYGTIKRNSMQNILNSNLNNSSISSAEKSVCRCILSLKTSVAAHYAAAGVPSASIDAVIPRGSTQTAATQLSAAAECGLSPNITAGAARLIEPWGLRYFAVYNIAQGASTVSDYGVVILGEADYSALYAQNPDGMRQNANAFVFRTSDDTLLYESEKDRYYATLTQGITSKDISDVYYVVPFAVLENGAYVYGTVKSNSMLRILNTNIGLASVSATEKAVSRGIISLYNAVRVYYGSL